MMSFFSRRSELVSTIFTSLSALPNSYKKKIKRVAVIQIALGLLDLLGIAIIGATASLAIAGINSKSPSNAVDNVLRFFNITSLSFQKQTAVLAIIALTIFISRTIFSVIFVRRTFYFLGRCGAEVAADLLRKILARPLSEIGRNSSQQYVYSLSSGVETLTLRIIGSSITLLADTTLLFFLLVALLWVDLSMTVLAVFVIGVASWTLHRLTNSKSRTLGATYSEIDISSRESLMDVLHLFREISSKGRTSFYENEFLKSRKIVSGAHAEYNFIPYMGKYVIETSVIIAAVVLAGAQFLLTDAANAITTLSIFMAAGSRLTPAILRIQQGVISLKNSSGIAASTLNLINEFQTPVSLNEEIKRFSNVHPGFIPKIELRNVSFRYPLSNTRTIEDISLTINSGETIALVGPSGSGKTTLVDLMMGLLLPDSGQITVSQSAPNEAISRWPGAIGYVPQEIYLSNASVAQNVAIGFPLSEIEQENIWQALEKAQISKFVSSLEYGLSTDLGDRGVKLSGGQKQRIGIARALLTNPKILFLDEATSALDIQTEHEVSEAINRLRGEVTLVYIAHRLSTAKRADRVIYLSAGKVIAEGTFEEVKTAVPDFQKQLEIMDLS